jgi:hypothetical protein
MRIALMGLTKRVSSVSRATLNAKRAQKRIRSSAPHVTLNPNFPFWTVIHALSNARLVSMATFRPQNASFAPNLANHAQVTQSPA